MNSRLTLIAGFVVLLIIAGIGLSTMKYVQVDEGQAAIELVQGRIVAVHGPGPIFRPFAPFTEIELVNVRRQSRQISQNVASSDKQLYDIDIQVDFRRLPTEQALRAAYAEIGVSDAQLNDFLDGFINDALKSASTQFTLDEALSDRGAFAERIRRFLTTPSGDGQRAPVDQLYITIEAVKVLDIKVGETYAQLLAEKANLEVQIETEQKRRQQIEAQQANNLFQAEQEALVALTREKGITAAALEAANREAQVRAIEGRYWRENPELFELRKRELLVQMLSQGNIWFVDPNTNLTILLNNQALDGQALVIPQPGTNNQPATPATPSQTPATP
ncbi:SPFH domain-containing protein [Chloroflexus sp.]|uniref:SPFH domain-containing protein n=1 Tax=Chloroflexus sp. TaxID=1904827 RepID=UPI00298F2537|nr:SPFH domain-containing protein [Chloroflexus sp.]MCS6887735.1 SPFH domain-containing protein [Chloroflexus sp.]MCX7860711.1 SPFH domain-containing protein [Chloroflexus sp.]MDW8403932.1 SPFH domain-containing protein [Chloroflexus sp.]